MSVKIQSRLSEQGNATRTLDRMPFALREKILTQAVRTTGTVVARATRSNAPKGKLTHHPGKPALRTTIRTRVRKKGTLVSAFVGPTYPEGAHGHLVEYGHFTATRVGVGWVPPHPFMRPAVDSTRTLQQKTMVDTMKRTFKKLTQ